MASHALRMDGVTTTMRPFAEIESKADKLNIELGFELLKQIATKPSLGDAIPDGAYVIHVVEGEPEVSAYNYALGERMASTGRRIAVCHWGRVSQSPNKRI